jgi:NTE family protein
MIQHLVISGGGPNFISHLGILQECVAHGILDQANLKAGFATSAGTVLCMLLAMRIPLSEIIEYFIDRPWDKWMKIDTMIFDMKCLCDAEALRDAIRPFFKAYDVPMSTSFAEFYERFGVDLHFFSTRLDTLDLIDLCRENFPDLSVAEAAVMSSSLPPIYRPVLYQDHFYVDGAFTNNFPVLECLKLAPPETVLAINNSYERTMPDFETVSAFTIMTHVVNSYMHKINQLTENVEAAKKCKHFISHNAYTMASSELWHKFLNSKETRLEMFDMGVKTAEMYFNEVEHC